MRDPVGREIIATDAAVPGESIFHRHLTEDTVRTLHGSRIFITGGTGYVGRWLLEGLLWANRCFALDLRLDLLTRRPDAFKADAPRLANDSAVCLLRGDVTDLSAQHGHYDHMIHAATDVTNPDADPVAAFDSIVAGTRQAIAFAGRAKVRRFLYLSSGAVYGRQPPELELVPEEFSGGPDFRTAGAAYGEAKRISEWLVEMNAAVCGYEAVTARLFAVFGPYMPLHARFAAGNFIDDIIQGRDIAIDGDGSPHRSYIYGADMACWLITMLARAESHTVYNVGSDRAISIAGLAELIARAEGGRKVSIKSATVPGQLPARYVPRIDKAEQELGLSIFTELESAITHTLDWFRRNSDNRP